VIVTDLTVTIDSEIATPMRQLVANAELVQRLLCGQNTVLMHQEGHLQSSIAPPLLQSCTVDASYGIN